MTKIRLSKKEKELIVNTDWILTKNEILKKVTLLLESLVTKQNKFLQSLMPSIPSEVFSTVAKISKGENYNGLPWRVLDYPRMFSKENICAIRTLFWWGKFFSVTLHLSGEYKKKFESSIILSYPLLIKRKIYYCSNVDQWQHHFSRHNYKLIETLGRKDFEKVVRGKDFIKLAKKIPLKKWNQMPEILLDYFIFFGMIIWGKH